MRLVFFIAMGGLLACGHAQLAAEKTHSPEAYGEGKSSPLALSLGQQAALWQALLTKLETKLEVGDMDGEEFMWLEEKLRQAWERQNKEGLPTALHLRTQAFLEKLQTLSPPDTDKAWLWPLWPVELSSPFGYRIHPLTGERRFHQGVDLRTTAREEIRSIQEGWVLHAGWAGGYGHMVEILHPCRSFSRYAHLYQVKVKVGQKVEAGTVVGLAGDSGMATGIHLHFELWKEGLPADPILHLPWPEAPWTEAPLPERPWTETPWTETPWTETPW